MSRKDDQLPDGGKVIDSEMAWFQFESECKLTGIQPGAFTAFTAGYDAGEKERDDLRAEVAKLTKLLDAVDEIVEAHWNGGDVRAAIRGFERVRATIAREALKEDNKR